MSSISDVLVYVRQHSSNSSEYYQKMTSHSINIHKKMFLRFFVPTEKELKVQYTTHEKCQILKKIMSSNLKNPKMPQIYLENRYNIPKHILDIVKYAKKRAKQLNCNFEIYERLQNLVDASL